MRKLFGSLAVAGVMLGGVGVAPAQTLKAVMHSDVKIVDPIWTTAYITRNHGYMIYDTLFAMDEKGEIKPQMVEKYDESADKLTYTFTLRDGLLWHDGKPVTAEDCVASIKRWAARDSVGQKLSTFIDTMTANDAKTFTVKLKAPTGLLIFGLGKPSSNVPFMMPKRVADTDPNTQISDFTGSGPFVMKQDEWKPGDKIVYVKFDKYKPRSEPASGLAGGKVVKLARVEWLAITDQQQATNALLGGEIDYFEQPPTDLLPLLKGDSNIKLVDYNPLGLQYTFRFNHLQKPFDNPKVRQALLYAFNQKDFLDATIGDANYYKVCKSIFPCGSTMENTKVMDGVLNSNFDKAKALLKEAGYDGSTITLLQSTDLAALTNLAPVAKSLMEKAGFKVDMQSMDWQTVVARRVKKDPPNAGGWHGMMTSWVSADILNPVMTGFINASCEKAMFGWPCDAEIEKLRDDFARETDPAKQKAIADAVQQRELEVVTHIHLGQYFQPVGLRKNVSGVLTAPAPVFWNIEKK
ncbi:glutathione-binding protein GsiB precursor [Variibacter gotjawalensis]|uniref:Glutathione-binding protein GsiB n=1 Tax=Variibacter gotjawalensis TaxID=1333996 RepID=A0A0S3PZF6_9BRAD|nr:ABC transporter substrate-binding protein [Variibacter gotjawalensis]NIK47136.1 peptide/nickel transport system substrate-binding protein [Variibacter gotjawalensis]RZS49036.1 peptide/nickel transport system substrate-binding protein [Variibacter gotjawalensis]BAT61298.1 glutathione-binding protein GsiB precursor [Variibacter gotjawalensis]